MKRPSLLLALPLAATLTLGVVACGSDDDSSSSTTTVAETSTTVASGTVTNVAFTKSVQYDLEKVGCYDGAVDGEDGPETTTAIEDFQKAEGLTVDGEAGTETMAALSSAVSAGATVCGSSGGSSASTTTSTTVPPNACADVTEAMVQETLGAESTIDNWKCATDAKDFPWVGGTATQGGEVDYNFILENGADVPFVRYSMNPCTNPPVPESLLSFCEAS